MNRRRIILSVGVVTLVVFLGALLVYERYFSGDNRDLAFITNDTLVRPGSPVIGPEAAPVTITEFFDPSCEACRAIYPTVKQIMMSYPGQVRLVVRYALFHQGSEEAARILEAARLQGVFQPVLEAVLASQPKWHDDPDAKEAMAAAIRAGLDLEAAREQMKSAEVDARLAQDMEDVKANGLTKTPTFFVNDQLLTRFGAQELAKLVDDEVARSRL